MAKFSDKFWSAIVLSRSGQIGQAVEILTEIASQPNDEGVVAKISLDLLYATHALRSDSAGEKARVKAVRGVLGDNPVVDLLKTDGYQQTAIEEIDGYPRAVLVRGANKQFVRYTQPAQPAEQSTGPKAVAV